MMKGETLVVTKSILKSIVEDNLREFYNVGLIQDEMLNDKFFTDRLVTLGKGFRSLINNTKLATNQKALDLLVKNSFTKLIDAYNIHKVQEKILA